MSRTNRAIEVARDFVNSCTNAYPCRVAKLASTPSASARKRIPDAAVARLPVYLHILSGEIASGVAQLSSDQLAALAGVNAAKVRKDLSYLGSYGTRGVGYEVTYLIHQIKRELGFVVCAYFADEIKVGEGFSPSCTNTIATFFEPTDSALEEAMGTYKRTNIIFANI